VLIFQLSDNFTVSVCCRCVCLVRVRLAGVNRPPNAGRLEIYYNGAWGTVCDNDFNDIDAKVACNMLSFRYFVFFSVDGIFVLAAKILNSVLLSRLTGPVKFNGWCPIDVES